MIEESPFAKSIVDVSWNQFSQFLTYKEEEAGRKLGLVKTLPIQHKHAVNAIIGKELSEREHSCSQCGYKATRDFNAAQNILALGLGGLGATSRSLCL